MKNINKYNIIAKLVLKKLTDSISEEENNILENWLNESNHNRKIYDALLEKNSIKENLHRYDNIDSSEGLERFYSRYENNPRRRKQRRRALGLVISSSAAALIAMSLLVYSPDSGNKTNDIISYADSKVQLIMDNNEIKDLKSESVEDITIGNVVINNNTQQLTYKSRNEGEEIKADVYNTLRTSVGGEYKLQLSDGTNVWLNSKSSLRFPVQFAGNQRVVYLEGEAYFDVSKDVEKPFIVKTLDNVEIKVYGTEFNLSAYSDNSSIEAVLVEGSIAMEYDGNKTMVKPNEMAQYSTADGKINLSEVETDLYTSWREGVYIFRNETLYTIFTKMARWYNIAPEFVDKELMNMRYSGNIERYSNMNKLLDALKLMGGVDFEIDGEKIYIVKD